MTLLNDLEDRLINEYMRTQVELMDTMDDVQLAHYLVYDEVIDATD